MTRKTEKEVEPVSTRYTKEQLAKAERYRGKSDVITALLEEGKPYTVAEVDEIMDKFMKGKVKVC